MGSWVSLAAYTVALLAFTIATLHRSMQSKRTSATALNKPPPPPGPVGHPLLGSLLYVIGPLRHNPHRSLVALAEAYGPIVFLRLGLTRAMAVVSSPAIAHEALVKNDAALAARLVPDNVRALSYGATSMVFLPSSDQLWRRRAEQAAEQDQLQEQQGKRAEQRARAHGAAAGAAGRVCKAVAGAAGRACGAAAGAAGAGAPEQRQEMRQEEQGEQRSRRWMN